MTQLGRYRLRRQLGRGAFATVHEAVDEVLDATVALKILDAGWATDPDVKERFVQEARLLRRVDHAALVRVFDIGETEDGRAWFAMTCATRDTLAGRIEARGGSGSWVRDDLALLIETLGAGLSALHAAEVVHRDITPRNILIDRTDPSGRPGRLFADDEKLLIADLGLAKDLATGGDVITMLGGTPRYQAPEQTTPLVPIDARADIYAASAVMWEVVTGAMPPLPHELHSRVQELTEPWRSFMAQGLAAAPHDRFDDVEAWSTAINELISDEIPVLSPPTGVVNINPYPGLRSFDESRAAFYSGREALADELVRRLRAERALMVGGASGAGKSSLLLAGVGPLVTGGMLGGGDWRVLSLTPGEDPVSNLDRLTSEAALQDEAASGRILLVVDQFEELVTRCKDAAEREEFVAGLEQFSTTGTSTRVVLAARSDFYGELARFPWIAELLERHVFVGPMRRGDLRRAVERPALRAGAPMTSELVEVVLDEAAESPGALPHVSHALAKTFDSSLGGPLTLEAYRHVGGVAGALTTSAEDVHVSLSSSEQADLRDLLLRLVDPGTDDKPDTRTAVALTLLPAPQRSIVDRLTAERLVTVYQPEYAEDAPAMVEIAHDALLTEWPRLSRWIDDARRDIGSHRRLSAAAQEWADRGEDPSYLLTGAQLARYTGWVGAAPVSLTDRERLLLVLSVEAEEARATERARQHQRDIALRRRTLLLSGLVVITAIVVGLAVFAFNQSDRANDLAEEAARNEQIAVGNAEEAADSAASARQSADLANRLAAELEGNSRALRLTAASAAARGSDPSLGLLLALDSARATAESGEVLPTAMDSIHWALQAARIQYPTVADPAPIVRSGPAGLTGIPDLSPNDLIAHAQRQPGRGYTADECSQYFGDLPCPDPSEAFPQGLEVAGGWAAYATHPTGATDLAGTTVSVTSAFSPGFGFEFVSAALDEVGDAIDITVTHTNPPEDRRVEDVARSDEPTDIVILPQPGFAAGLARDGLLMDVSQYLDVDVLRDSYQDYLFGLSTVGPNGEWPTVAGSPVGVFAGVNGKTFMWHTTATFTEAGYATPDTWDGLIALSDQIVADGETPWCMALESGDSSGWPASDWVESVILRSEGPDFYDQWVNHEVPFDHPAVVAAFDRIGELAFGPGYVQPSAAGAAVRPFFDLGFLMNADPPQCLMLPFPNFAPNLPPGLAVGETIELFDFPTLSPQYATAMVGGGDIAVAMTDRPEVRAVIEAMSQPEWGRAWAEAGDGFAFVPANRYFDLSVFPTAEGRQIAQRVRTALAEGTYRFDGSDSMPSQVEAAFLSSLVSFFQEGPGSAPALLAEVESVWLELEQAG